MSIPIIFTHRGYSDYMEYSLRQAKFSNQDSEVVLLGDDRNDRFDFVTHEKITDFGEKAQEFSLKYKHFSTNPYNYEMFCIQRWFIISEYMQKRGIKKAFLCDTDVLIYSDLQQALRPFQAKGIALIKRGEEYSLGISYITLEMLILFCNYIFDCYNSDRCIAEFAQYYQNLRKNNMLGGISDMTLISKAIKAMPADAVSSLLEVHDNATFDLHIGIPDQMEGDYYRFFSGRKVIRWEKGHPYCFSFRYKRLILFHLLHFQGPSKYLMSKFYTGPRFPGKRKLDVKFFLANIAAFWYRHLRIRYRFARIFDLYFSWKQKRQESTGRPFI